MKKKHSKKKNKLHSKHLSKEIDKNVVDFIKLISTHPAYQEKSSNT